MFRTLALVPLGSLLLSAALADEPKRHEPAASALLSTVLARAKDQGRRVFLLFGSPGLSWCRVSRSTLPIGRSAESLKSTLSWSISMW
jgi:hypothetical protein